MLPGNSDEITSQDSRFLTSGLLFDLGISMLNVVRSFGLWVFAAVLICAEFPLYGQWIDIKSLPEDVLNCDECRRRLGLPPLTDLNRKPSSHGTDSTIVPSTNATFNEIILSTRVLPGPSSTTTTALPSESPSQSNPHSSNKPVLPSPLPKIDISNVPAPTPTVGKTNPDIDKKEPTPSKLPASSSNSPTWASKPPAPPVAAETAEQVTTKKIDEAQPAVDATSTSQSTLPTPAVNQQVANAKPEIQANSSLPKVEETAAVPAKSESASSSMTVYVEPKQAIDPKAENELKKSLESSSVQPVEKGKSPQDLTIEKRETAPQPKPSEKPQDSIAKTLPKSENAKKSSSKNDRQKDDESKVVENRLPPALTGELGASELSNVASAKALSVENKPSSLEDEEIAIAVPTSGNTDSPKIMSNAASASDINEPSREIKNSPATSQTVSVDQTSVAPISPDSLIVDGVLTSPTAQKIQIDILKKQLDERDNLLNEFSRMQKSLEERIDSIVRSNEQLSQKESLRAKELERLHRESEKNIQERDLHIANLRAELAGARADTKNQLTMLAKQLTEAQHSKSAEILKLSDELLAARKARLEQISSAKGQQTTEQHNELVEAEKVVEEQRKVIQDLQTALKKLGNQLEKLDEASEVEKIVMPSFPTVGARSNSNTMATKGKAANASESKPANSSGSSSKTSSDLGRESKTQSLTQPTNPPSSESNPKRRSF